MSRDPIGAPPLIEPGTIQRTTTADENDPSSLCTGRGDRILGADAESCQPFPG